MGTKEKKANFINLYADAAVADAIVSGVPPSIKLAQAILESGWGESGLTVKAFNFFGIKAGSSWKGKVWNVETHEYYDGVTRTNVKADFRAYGSPEESFADHTALFKRLSRYAPLFDLDFMDYKGWAHQLKKSGYATSPTYPQKLIAIIEQNDLTRFDVEAKKKSGGSSDSDPGVSPNPGASNPQKEVILDYDLIAQKVARILIEKLNK